MERRGRALEEDRVGRLEERRQVSRAGEVVVDRGGQERAGAVGAPVDLPVLAQGDEELLVHAEGLGRGLDVDVRRTLRGEDGLRVARDGRVGLGTAEPAGLVGEEPDLLGVEVGAVPGPDAAVAVAPAVGEDRGGRGDEEHLGVLHRPAAAQAQEDARVAGVRERALAEVLGEEDRLAGVVGPLRGALGGAAGEAAVGGVDEGVGVEVHLAGDVGVRAAVGEVDEGAAAGERTLAQDLRAVPDPGGALGLAQPVEVEQDLPLGGAGGRAVGAGCAGAVGVPGGAAPQAARVLGVGPEVVEHPRDLGDGRDLVRGVVGGLEVGADGIEVGVAVVLGAGGGVALGDPGEGLPALDVVEPGGDVGELGGGVEGAEVRGGERGGRHGVIASRRRAGAVRDLECVARHL